MLDAEWTEKARRLLALLPALEAAEREPESLGRWHLEPGLMPFFEYRCSALELLHERVVEDGWFDYHYVDSPAVERVQSPAGIARLTLQQVGTALTWVIRGERFCEGHMAGRVADGTVTGVLRRLQALCETPGLEAPPGWARESRRGGSAGE